MLVLVCGSRSWRDGEAIRKRLARLPRGTTVLHGGARGADRLAGTVARSLGLAVVELRADWSRGRWAGLERNLAMLDRGPDLVLAFWDGASGGTAHCIAHAERRGIPVERILSFASFAP